MSEWIKYSECCPEIDGHYLVYCPEYRLVEIERYDTDLGGWLDFSDEEVSHWQEPPDPPKE